MSDKIKTKIVNNPKMDNNSTVLNEEQIKEMTTPLPPNKLPSSEEILTQINKILEFMCTDKMLEVRTNDIKNFKYIVRDKFEKFNEKYPTIMDIIIDGGDLSFLYKMLEKIDLVKQNKQKLRNVEIDLRDEMAEKYVYPNLTAKEIKRIKKKLDKKKKT